MTDAAPPMADENPLPPGAMPTPEMATAERGGAAPPPDLSTWRQLPAAARGVFQGGGVVAGILFSLPIYLGVAIEVLEGWKMHLVGLVLIPLAGAALGFRIATRRWASTSWRLDERGLQVRRGHLFNREIFVPRARVQHLDLERGPIERHFGLATIVIHTAGTRLHALRQSGLAEADAVALRDALVPVADTDDDAA